MKEEAKADNHGCAGQANHIGGGNGLAVKNFVALTETRGQFLKLMAADTQSVPGF